MLPIPKFEIIGGCSSCTCTNVVSHATSAVLAVTCREFPQDKVARISKTEVAGSVQALADISALSNLAASLVLLLLRCADLREVDLDVGRELQRRSVERTCFLFG